MSKKPMFVRFEVTPDIVERAYETVKLATEDGKIRKGANESTKAVDRGVAKLLVIAQDVDPPEIVAHLPLLADDKKIAYVYVDSKSKLGESAGIDVPTSAVAVIEAGKGRSLLEEVISKVAALRLKGAPETAKEAPVKPEAPKEALKEAPKKEIPKKEAAKEAPLPAPKKAEEAPKKEKPKRKAPKKAEKAEKGET
ncbi:MAG: 50S ribosomal protein L7Ae [Candidatus Methanomethyliaceae archaeon]|nr:50S ribosomal protein L7Ae [Candidatus Methanomethyliaceae archaeon]